MTIDKPQLLSLQGLGASSQNWISKHKNRPMKAVMYHYVRPLGSSPKNFRFLSCGNFKRQLDWFRANGGFVSKHEFINYLTGGDIPKGYLLTFDDGLRDHYDYVLPELLERKLWAMFFVCGQTCEESSTLLNVHRIHELIAHYGADFLNPILEQITGQSLESIVPQATYLSQDTGQVEKNIKYLLNHMYDNQKNTGILNRLITDLNFDEQGKSKGFYLTHQQRMKLKQHGMAVLPHSYSHTRMSNLSPTSCNREISSSIAMIKPYQLPGLAQGFCLPYGGPSSYTRMVLDKLADNNVQFNFSVESKPISKCSSLLALPRFDCNEFPFGTASMG